MLRRLAPALLLGACLAHACGDPSFRCTDDTQCARDGLQGQCQGNQFCTFPDDTCPSGQRYGEDAGSGLANMCLNVDEAGTDDPTTASDPTSSEDDPATTSATTSPIPMTTGAGDSTTTDDTPSGNPYDDCNDDEDCPVPGSVCIDFGPTEVCIPPCTTSDECPPAPGTSASPVCAADQTTGDGRCVLLCETDLDCPPGMECAFEAVELVGEFICAND